MKLEKKVERGVDEILIADVDPFMAKKLSAYMASTGKYKRDGPIRRSDVTRDWFQWWHKIEAVKWSATKLGLKPLNI